MGRGRAQPHWRRSSAPPRSSARSQPGSAPRASGRTREDDRRACPDGKLAHQPVVGAGIAEDPARAVDVHDHRERPRSAFGPDDPDLDTAGRAGGDGDPLLVDGGLIDLARWTPSTAARPSAGGSSNRNGRAAVASANACAADSRTGALDVAVAMRTSLVVERPAVCRTPHSNREAMPPCRASRVALTGSLPRRLMLRSEQPPLFPRRMSGSAPSALRRPGS